MFNFGFSFIHCCLIWCVETKAGTDQAHKYFSWCSNLQRHLVAATYHTWSFSFLKFPVVDIVYFSLQAFPTMRCFEHQNFPFASRECCSSCHEGAHISIGHALFKTALLDLLLSFSTKQPKYSGWCGWLIFFSFANVPCQRDKRPLPVSPELYPILERTTHFAPIMSQNKHEYSLSYIWNSHPPPVISSHSSGSTQGAANPER